jgi:hypothetical protein
VLTQSCGSGLKKGSGSGFKGLKWPQYDRNNSNKGFEELDVISRDFFFKLEVLLRGLARNKNNSE